MKKILFAFLLALTVFTCSGQFHMFNGISFSQGGELYQCAFAPSTITFNNTPYLAFPGFGTTHSVAAYGDHSHPSTYVTPADQILHWDGSKYLPYAAKYVVAPAYAYFYSGIENPTSFFTAPVIKLDGSLTVPRAMVVSNDGHTVIDFTPGQLAWAYTPTGHSYEMLTYSNNGKYYTNTFDRTVARGIEYLIGSNASLGDYHGEYISIDDYNRKFTINMTKILLNKGTAGKYLHTDANKEIEYVDLTPGSVGLSNVTNNAQVTAVSAAAPIVSSGGTTPVISITKSGGASAGYLSSEDWNDFNGKVSSQWTNNAWDLYYMKGKVGIGLTNPAFTSDVYGSANIYDYKSSLNYISKLKISQGNSTMSGIWSSATDSVPYQLHVKDISEEKSSGYVYNTSFVADPFMGAYMYFYSRDYNYQVGLFDRMGHKKAFCGIMGGGMPTQPYPNLGDASYPWGKSYFADSLFSKNIKAVGNVVASGNLMPSSGNAQFNMSNIVTWSDDFGIYCNGGSTSKLKFFTNSVEAMRITPEQNIGMGTETPHEKLDVHGSIKSDSAVKSDGLYTSIRQLSCRKIDYDAYINHVDFHQDSPFEYQHTIIISDLMDKQTLTIFLPDPATCVGQEFVICNQSREQDGQNILIRCPVASVVFGVNSMGQDLGERGIYFDYGQCADIYNFNSPDRCGNGCMTFQAISNTEYMMIHRDIRAYRE
ncbi:MAG: hypothetical protein NT040_11275 [Bacteroidetes bacterium]|nr:hypothetical protein [Bacteroidota bacterium]